MIEFDEKSAQFRLTEEATAFFSTIRESFAVLTVAGMYRTGKSYLLNRLVLNKQTGFKVGPSTNACTKGLWLWPKLLLGTNANGEKVPIVVIDTEGIGSTKVDNNYDNKVFSLAVLLSSGFIYNSLNSIDETAISNLSFIANITNSIQIKTSNNERSVAASFSKHLPKFYWILRDFSLELLDQNERKISPRDYLENCLEEQPGYTEPVLKRNTIRKILKDFFPERDCFTLVRPVNEEVKLRSMESLTEDDLRKEFIDQIDYMRKKIFNNLKEKSVEGRKLTGEMYIDLIENYISCINSGSVPNVDQAWSNVCKMEEERIISSTKNLIDQFKTTVTFPISKSELKSHLEKLDINSNLLIKNSSIAGSSSSLLKSIEEILLKAKEEAKEENTRTAETLMNEEIETALSVFLSNSTVTADNLNNLKVKLTNLSFGLACDNKICYERLLSFFASMVDKEKEAVEMVKDQHYQKIIDELRTSICELNKELNTRNEEYLKERTELLKTQNTLNLDLTMINASNETIKEDLENHKEQVARLNEELMRKTKEMVLEINSMRIEKESWESKFEKLSNDTSKEWNKKLTEMKQKIETETEIKETNKKQIEDLEEKIETLENNLETLTETITCLKSEISQKDLKIEELRRNNSESIETLENHYNKIIEDNRIFANKEKEKMKTKEEKLKETVKKMEETCDILRNEKVELASLIEGQKESIQHLNTTLAEKETLMNKIKEKDQEILNLFSEKHDNKELEVEIMKLKNKHHEEKLLMEEKLKEIENSFDGEKNEKNRLIEELKSEKLIMDEHLNRTIENLREQILEMSEEIQTKDLKVAEMSASIETLKKNIIEKESNLRLECAKELMAEKEVLNTNTQRLKEGFENKKKEMTDYFKTEIEKLRANYEESLNEKKNEYEAKLENINFEHEQNIYETNEYINELTDELNEKIKMLGEKEIELKNLKDTLAEKEVMIENVINRYETKLNNISSTFKEATDQLTESINSELRIVRTKNEQLSESLAKETNQRENLQELLKKRESKIEDLRGSIAQAEEEKIILKEKHKTQLDSKDLLLKHKAEEFTNLRMEALKNETILSQNLEHKVTELKELKELLKEETSKAAEELERLKESLTTDFESKLKQTQIEKAHLATRYDAKKKEFKKNETEARSKISALEQEKINLNNKIESLEEKNKDMLNNHKIKIQSLEKELSHFSSLNKSFTSKVSVNDSKVTISDLKGQLKSLNDIFHVKEKNLLEKIVRLETENSELLSKQSNLIQNLKDTELTKREELQRNYEHRLKEQVEAHESLISEMKLRYEAAIEELRVKIVELKVASHNDTSIRTTVEREALVRIKTLEESVSIKERRILVLESELKANFNVINDEELRRKLEDDSKQWMDAIKVYENKLQEAQGEVQKLRDERDTKSYVWEVERKNLENKIDKMYEEKKQLLVDNDILKKERSSHLRNNSRSKKQSMDSNPNYTSYTPSNKENIPLNTINYDVTGLSCFKARRNLASEFAGSKTEEE